MSSVDVTSDGEDAVVYRAINILNAAENPIKDRDVWWDNTTLHMKSGNASQFEVRDDDAHACWREVFWTKWIATFDQWNHVSRYP